MKKIIILFVIFSVIMFEAEAQQYQPADSITVQLARKFSQDIFETNGTPYLKPMVQSMNATSNSRFFNSAYVPTKVKKPYFKVSVNTMVGFVPDNMKTYSPVLPAEQLDMSKLSQYMDIYPLNIKDTVGLAYYAMKTIFYDGIKQGKIVVPEKSATILGTQNSIFHLDHTVMKELVHSNPAYLLLPASFKMQLDSIIEQFPENFTLPQGANMNSFVAAIPQFEIGSLYGTELLLRFVPPVNMGKNIGDFAFWGIGLKHSISQYFYDYKAEEDDSPIDINRKIVRPFDMAVQAVYQGTYLKNKVGVTNADLTAWANIWDFNIQLSANVFGWFDIYSGLSYEIMNISSEYVYALPWEVQIQLGLLKAKTDGNGEYVRDKNGWVVYETADGYPGDSSPQKSTVKVSDTNFKWIIGLSKDIGKFSIFADYNMSSFDIFTAGIMYKF
jgi:hypothetical protein